MKAGRKGGRGRRGKGERGERERERERVRFFAMVFGGGVKEESR